MLYRGFLGVVDRLPMPSLRVQRLIAALVILSQAGISVTGAIVRVTASGLGCPTWPQCFPGSFTPVGVSEVPVVHQAVEFGNRMLTFVVVLCAAAIVLAVTRARRRHEVLLYAWLMPGGTVVQAIIGGITVRTGLLWWTVAVHLLASMAMVWLAVLLFVKVGEPDDGVPTVRIPAPLRGLTALSGVALAGVLVAGTLVTGAGPHAGDKSIERTVPRLEVEIVTLVHLHSPAAGRVSRSADRARVRAVRGRGERLRQATAVRPRRAGAGAVPDRGPAVLHRRARSPGGVPRRWRGGVYGGDGGVVGGGPDPRTRADRACDARS